MGHCCGHIEPTTNRIFRRALVIALAVNAGMFVIELSAGLAAKSVSLQADALDFLGDSASYAISLCVLGLHLRWRAAAALLKGITMGLFGIFVLGAAVWHALSGSLPGAFVMGSVGFAALAANVGVALLLMRFRDGDSNMRSVWLCTRNDAISNLAVIVAGAAVFATQTGWPDIIVAMIMSTLALTASASVIRHALSEIKGDSPALIAAD